MATKEALVKPRSIPVIGALAALLAIAAVAPVAASGPHTGTVYTLSNAVSGNAVVAYSRAGDGSLTPLGTFPTGGLGSGAGLGSQGTVTLSNDGRILLAVDPGSDELTAFRVRPDGRLSFADRISSGGDHPISAAIRGDLVYVVNDGGAGNIAGFRIDGRGDLTAIDGSVQPLSSGASAPAEIAFAGHGRVLVVTEKATNRITTYALGPRGRAGSPTWITSAGETPYGFDVDPRGRLIVSEAAGGAPDASTVSSYGLTRHGIQVLDGPVATTETAACWVVVTGDGRFAYAANTGSGTITGFSIARDGDLHILDADGATGVSGGAPSDLSLSAGSRFLYVRTGDSIHAFRVAWNGSLADLGATTVQPGIVGLAAD
jgi:6-phosphogluconolactonase